MSTPPSEPARGLVPRIREFVRTFLPDRAPADELTLEGAAARGPLEGAAAVLGATFERWRQGGGVVRFLQAQGRDRVTSVGVAVALTVPIDAITRLRAARVRVRVGEHVAGEFEVAGPTLTLTVTPTSAGLQPVIVDALDRRGEVIGWGSAQDAPIVHVIDGAPVVAIDAVLLLGEPMADLSALHGLARRGWAFLYIDFGEVDRQAPIREAVGRSGLPRGAILSHLRAEIEFRTLGIDFRRIFAATRIRRLRADGVPVVLVLSPDGEGWASAAGDGIASLTLGALAGREAEIPAWEGIARDFVGARAAADPLTWRLDLLSASTAIAGNRCRIELDNRRARARIFAAIDGAQVSVHLQFYILSPGLFTERLAVRLIRRARAGVAIRLIVDALYSTQEVLGLHNPIVQGLAKEPGIAIVAASPIASDGLGAAALKRRDHRKMIIIDGALAFVGGRNCGDEYYTGFDEVPITDFTPHERVPWLDAHVEARGPICAAIERAFVRGWLQGGGAAVVAAGDGVALAGVGVAEIDDLAALALEGGAAAPPATEVDAPAEVDAAAEVAEADLAAPEEVDAAGTSRARLVLHEGLVDTNTLGAYEAIIDTASDRLHVINDFPILGSLQAALVRAIERGVRVVILTGSAVARRGDGTMLRGPLHRELFEYMTKQRLEPLIRAGAEVYEYATPPLPEIVVTGEVIRPYVHAKVMCADGRVASVGSANLDATASYWEHEINVVIEDPAVVAALERTIAEMIAGSYRLDLESAYWRREARQREVSATLWPEALYS